MDQNKSVFVREANGPLGEIRYREVSRTDQYSAGAIKQALQQIGRQVVVQTDRRPPHSY